MNQTILVLDFGGQYKELIARRIREKHVYSVIEPCTISVERIREINPIGIIFTGGPYSVYADHAPKCDPAILKLGIPVLGICYGMQILAHMLGGKVESCAVSEYGKIKTDLDLSSPLFSGLKESEITLMSHTDYVA